MSARRRTSVRSYEWTSKRTPKKLVLENSFDVSGPQIATSASAPLDRMPPAKRKRASNFSIKLGLVITGIYIAINKGIAVILTVLGMKIGHSEMMTNGLQAIQFDHTDKIILATFLGSFALIALIFRFPEIRKTITELLRNTTPYIKR